MKKILTLLVLLSVAYAMQAQLYIFVLENNGNTRTYDNLADCIDNAVAGDTLYLPGGTFSGTITIDKELHLFGAGYHPDSTTATMPTYFSSRLELTTGAGSSSIEGIRFNGIYMHTGVSNISIKRCYGNNINFVNENSSNNYVEECIVGYISSGTNNLIYKSFVKQINNMKNSFVKNCILSYQSSSNSSSARVFYGIENFVFQNNYILDNYNYLSHEDVVTNSLFENNCFWTNITWPQGSNIGNNNVYGSQSAIFENWSGSGYFSYSYDYRIKAGSVAENAGTDGTDIGIYGTAQPFKDGGLPVNPHIRSKEFGFELNENGKLYINVSAGAQDE